MAQAAKPPAKQDAAAAVPAPAAKRSTKLLLFIVLAAVFVLLIAVLGIGALLIMKKNNNGHEAAAPTPPPIQETSLVNLDKPPVFAQLDPFTVDLRSESSEESHYLQTVMALRVADQRTADALKGWMPEIRHRVNMLISSKRPEDIQSSTAREALAGEIQEQINTMLGVPPPPPGSQSLAQPPIQAVLFSSFIIQ
ncbi:MAG: flagellar basal body-associated FliL family protein [Azoarcus sp.]|jgi:flagellar FliL protein|nr:flagellar basal body-associated FliL family protein [Azoarcus sp.]